MLGNKTVTYIEKDLREAEFKDKKLMKVCQYAVHWGVSVVAVLNTQVPLA